jgi:hypothetical protein
MNGTNIKPFKYFLLKVCGTTVQYTNFLSLTIISVGKIIHYYKDKMIGNGEF